MKSFVCGYTVCFCNHLYSIYSSNDVVFVFKLLYLLESKNSFFVRRLETF